MATGRDSGFRNHICGFTGLSHYFIYNIIYIYKYI